MSEGAQLSRRDLLRGRLFGRIVDVAAKRLGEVESAAKIVESQLKPAHPVTPGPGRRFAIPVHRPPGAVNEAAFLSGCTRCDACIEACPAGAIVHAPARFREAAGTPMIDAHTAACIMCPDAPCIESCEPRVLRPDQPRTMGVAWIQTEACLAYTGSFCSVCAERCPVPGSIDVTSGKPSIRADACTGCGVCATVCPAPTNAVVVMPIADRPAPSPRPSPTPTEQNLDV